MRTVTTGIVLLLMSCGAVAAQPETPEEFFERFVSMGHRFDPSVVSLYADDASIKMYRRYPHGLERAMEMSGAEWKALITKTMPLARAKNDKSTFSNVRVSMSDGKAKIKADRYAVRKCYTDSGYYMVIEMKSSGHYAIVEEYLESQPKPDC